ncbi:TcdA/TcdB catalytic glycosyltransferase domain-containing protein [Candidatus Fukatsuia endosymbiont of Tuberolachnus salignus]|uniref:TcdA/TcdB catalytic glycosyltransferase domain-containing protein n=1 Tax=Candidatus Fukatsuia endosymbiont of Tuberolachnus salignus TaxID=3077957 RepID=UPI00313BBBC4
MELQTVQYLDVARQLGDIKIDKSEYDKKENYYKFITARNQYLNLTTSSTPSNKVEPAQLDETSLLLKMMFYLDKWVAINNNKGERRYNPFLAQILLARKNTIMETVPKTIHFICLCTMTDIQRDYINLWLKNNPDYLVKIWTDDDSLLVQKLVTCIQEKAAKETLMYFLPRNFNNFQETIKIFLKFKSKGNTYYTNETNQEKNEIEFFDEYFYNNPLNTEFNKTITTLIDVSIELREGHLNFDIIEMTYPEEMEVIKRTFIRQKYNSFSQRFFYWQEKFYRYFLNEKEKGDVCFDQCVIDFCIKNGLEERENLEKERTKNRAIFTKMRDYLKAANPENNIELIYKNPDGNFQSNYLNELRGNLSAASGIFALNVLISEGGIYLGTDLLPAINENLFVDLIDKTPDDPNGTLSQTIISRIILDELGNDGQMPGRTEALVKSYQLDKIDPQIESSIKNIIIEAKQRKIPLFMGLDEIKVDPYFQSSYADGNVKMLIASVKEGENNQFISKLLNNWIETYRIILQHGIHAIQLSVPNSLRNAITSTQEAFARKNLKVNAKALIHYHWDILSQYEQAIPELLGTPAYDCVYSQLLKELLNSESVETQTIDFYSFQKKVTPSFNSATFLTEEATQSHLMGAQRYLKPFINSPQYVGQCIIQLKDDVISEKTAKFLYNNNSDISEWYRYDEETKRLIPQSVGTQIDSQQEKCLIWVGNGYPIAIIDAINFLQLTQQILLKNNFHVEQMTLIACQPRRTGPIAGVGNKTLSIEGLFHACENSKPKINIKRIVAQESLFMVDMMGRQWKGSLFVNGISTGVKREIDWRIVTENDSEVIATFSGDKPQGAYTYTIPRLGTSVLTRNRVISESNKAAFGLGSVIETPLVNPGRLPPWKNNPAKLDGWIEQTMAERISQDLKNGVVVMAAESIVLVAAMCESIHELIISDPHLARIKTLMQVLERSLEVNTYVDWFASLDFACGEKQFNHLINALFTTPNELDRAFRRLQWRVCHKRFTFFNLSLSEKDNAKRIRRGMKSKTTIQAIFLGSIEEALLPGMEIDADDSTQLAQVANKVTNLNANFSDLVNDLENADNAPRSLPKLYTYSLYDPERSLIGNVETVFEKSNFNIDYIHRLLQFAWNKNKLSLSFADTAQYTKRQAWRRANLHASQGKHKKLAMNEWRLLLASIKYKTIDENYIISQLNTTRHNTIDVSAKDLSFARMMLYLNKNLQLVETNRVLKRKKRPIARSVGSMGGAGGIGGTSDSFSSLWHFFIDFTSTSDLEKKEEEIPVNKKVHSWVSLLSDFINVMSLPSTVIDGGDRLLESAINTSWLYEKCKTPINTLWNVLYQAANSEKNKWFNDIATKTGQGLGVISLLFDAYEYHEAQNHHQRSLAVTKATFDGASLAWGIAAENIMQSSAEFPPLLIVIIASYSLSKISQAIGNDIEIMFDNITRARLCGVEFNQLKNGFEKGGFTVINDTLMPCKGSVIKTINLENTRKPFVVFDDIGVQMRKKTDQGEDFIVDSNDPAAYINLRELNGVALDQSIDITGLPSFNQPALKKLVLPMSPKIKIDPVYTETDLIKWRGDTEFDAMRYFSSRESKFIFEFYKENSFIDPIKNFLGTNWMAITNLNYRYQKNNVNVYLGNDDYKLIAPGIEKNERTDDSLYRKYLHYKLYGPTKGKATIFILLNRGQSDITIARSNPSITWIIGAYHENFRDTKVEPISNGCKIFRTVPNASGETDDAIYINIDDRDNTKLTFHLSIGVGTIDFKGSTTHSVGKLIVREFNATIFKTQLTPQIIDFLDGDRRIRNMDEASRMPQMVRAYLEEMTKDSAKVLKYIPVKNLAIFGNE